MRVPDRLVRLARRVLRALLRARLAEGGASGLGARGPWLAVCNHASPMDALVLWCLVDCDVVIVSRHDLKARSLRLACRLLGYQVADLSEARTVRRLARMMASGLRVVVFPEGRPSRTGGLMKLYEAPAMVAARSGVGVVPLWISGTSRTLRRREVRSFAELLRRRITVHAMPQMRISLRAGLPARERRRQAELRMRAALQFAAVEARPRVTLQDAFLGAVALHGRRARVLEDLNQIEYRYGDLLKATLALGRLSARVTAPREVVGVLMPNLMPTVALVLGLGAMGRVPAILNYSSGPDAVRTALKAAGIRTVVTSRKFIEAGRLDRLIRAMSDVSVVYVEDLRAALSVADKLWLMLRALPSPHRVLPRISPSEPAVVLFTSGSEGRSKGVVLSHDAVLANMAQLHAAIDFGAEDKFLNALPMYHTYGLIACTLMPLVYGTRLFLYTNPLHYRVVPEIAYSRDCTYLFGTGTFLANYGRHARPHDFCSVRYVIAGGEKLNPEVQRLYQERFGLRVLEGYGATECGPAMALNVPQRYRPGTVGALLPGVEAKVTPVPGLSGGGMLHVRSPNLMSGYLLPEHPGEVRFPDGELGPGWYSTGDIVDLDEDGFLTILGRLRRFAKVAGEMVSLELVERLARACSPAHQHAATIADEENRGEATVLFTTDPGLDRGQLRQHARANGMQDLAVPRQVVHVKSLPVLGNGKTDYVGLTHLARKSGGGPEARDAAAAPVPEPGGRVHSVPERFVASAGDRGAYR